MKNDINAAGESEELANEYETRAVGKAPERSDVGAGSPGAVLGMVRKGDPRVQ